MRHWVATSLVATMILSNVAQAQAQTPVAPAGDTTTVMDVVVVGGKIAPTTEDPKSATCEFLVATDSFLRAQLAVAARGGDPFYMGDLGDISQAAPPASPPSALFAPTIYLPTRLPLPVDRVSAPLTPVGAALPEIGRQYLGVTARSAKGADTATETAERRLYNIGGGGMAVPGEFSIQDGIAACRGFQGSSPGSSEIAFRDKLMPTAMALFEHRRYAESLDYFERAFKKLSYENGGDEAALMIGKLYLGAPGVDRNMRQAVFWLERAAGAKFNPTINMPQFDPREPQRNTAIGEAAMILGALYQSGQPDLAKNAAHARKWFERALYVGHVRACGVLGDIHYHGKDTPRDLAQAFKYYRQGATLGYAPTQQALAEMYYSGDAPGGRDLKLALAWHSQAAKIGHAPSLFALASAVENGEGVAADPERALSLYKLSALAGNPAGINAVGTYFYDGRAMPKDQALARRWFEQAAIAGDPDAMFNLGAMLMKGEGGSTDRTRAWVWLKLADKGQNPNAPTAVRVLESRMTPEEKSEAAKILAPTNA